MFERGIWNSFTNYSKSGVLSRSLLKVWHHILHEKMTWQNFFLWNFMKCDACSQVSITLNIVGFDLMWKKFEWGCFNKEILSSPPFRVDVLVVKLMKVLIFKRNKSTKHFIVKWFLRWIWIVDIRYFLQSIYRSISLNNVWIFVFRMH